MTPLDQKSTQDKSSKNPVKEKKNKISKEKAELNIPPVPEAPKKIEKITVKSPGLSTDLLKKMKSLKSIDNEVVLVNCQRCKEVIPIPIPKKFIKNSELPIIPISFVHKNPKGEDLHCIIIHLDHDFDVRRQRISEVVISSD